MQNSQSSDYYAQLQDLNKLTRGQYGGLQTGKYQSELSAMQEKIAQAQTQLSLAKKDYDRANLLYKVERKLMEDSAEPETHLVESITSVRTIKQFGVETFANNKTDNAFSTLLNVLSRGQLQALHL